MGKIIIAIDGYSSTGKSTLAKKIAKKLGYIYVDTGAMYRAVSLYAFHKGYINKELFDADKLIANLDHINLKFKYNESLAYSEIYLNGKNIEKDIRSLEISNFVSKVAAVPEVRKKLVEQQQTMGLKKGIVMDGRDIGTVVFPEAELKIFMTASSEKRAHRRYKEMIDNGNDVTYESVLDNVNSRDLLDTTRKDSPLIKANDAIEVDNSNLSVNETFDTVYQYVKRKIS
ncbi:MAG: (d)CMP kinase [Flavobacteriaceae bacterium]|nr:(d)CMP kinase [Flavobacteriaceae bacterium]